MNKNNKGFMMAEVIVVSAIVMAVVATMFISYNQIYSKYKARVSYYDTQLLYRLAFYRDVLIEEQSNNPPKGLNAIIASLQGNYVEIDDNNYMSSDDYVLLIDAEEINSVISDLSNIPQAGKFIDYLSYINSSTKFKSKYLMIGESCSDDDGNDCTYAYLEIFDGYEDDSDGGN